MPIINQEEFKNGVKNGDFIVFTVDTNIVEGNKYAFLFEPLNLLNDLDEDVIFVMSDIVYMEVIKRFTQETYTNLTKAKNSARQINYIDKFKEFYEYASEFKYEEHCKKTVDTIFERTNNLILPSNLKVDKIVSSYFDKVPPFGNKEKLKCEFPDAIALNSLENYAIENDKKIIVLTKDKGWIEFCKRSSFLYAYAKEAKSSDLLKDAIFSFRFKNIRKEIHTKNFESYIKSENDNRIKQQIYSAIECYIDNTTNIEYEFDSDYNIDIDFHDSSLESIDFLRGSYEISNVDDEIVEFECMVPIEISCTIDVDFLLYDSEDKEYLTLANDDVSTDELVWLEFAATLDVNEDGGIDEDSTVTVTIPEKQVHVDFGNISMPSHFYEEDEDLS